MPHDISLITTIAAGLSLALVLGYLAARVEIARTLNPRIEILIRTHSDEEAALLR